MENPRPDPILEGTPAQVQFSPRFCLGIDESDLVRLEHFISFSAAPVVATHMIAQKRLEGVSPPRERLGGHRVSRREPACSMASPRCCSLPWSMRCHAFLSSRTQQARRVRRHFARYSSHCWAIALLTYVSRQVIERSICHSLDSEGPAAGCLMIGETG